VTGAGNCTSPLLRGPLEGTISRIVGSMTGSPGPVKTTRYFREQVLRKRSYLQVSWVESVLRNPKQLSVQDDGRIRFWGWVPELGHWLRVVTLEDGETVHNAFPDRDFEPGARS
jgi:hypothetical protein